jgi:hypothetical protein
VLTTTSSGDLNDGGQIDVVSILWLLFEVLIRVRHEQRYLSRTHGRSPATSRHVALEVVADRRGTLRVGDRPAVRDGPVRHWVFSYDDEQWCEG